MKSLYAKKTIKLPPEELVRQLHTKKLIEHYGYEKERIAFEQPIKLGREDKLIDKARACWKK